jgi:hypothetical protein
MTRQEFQKLLDDVDWFYQYADGDAYRKGRMTFDRARMAAKQSDEFKNMFNAKFLEIHNRKAL